MTQKLVETGIHAPHPAFMNLNKGIAQLHVSQQLECCLSLYNGLSHGEENTGIGLTFLL